MGAAARTIANFGFRRLAVAAPYEEHWREAKSAVQAEDLLHIIEGIARRDKHDFGAVALGFSEQG